MAKMKKIDSKLQDCFSSFSLVDVSVKEHCDSISKGCFINRSNVNEIKTSEVKNLKETYNDFQKKSYSNKRDVLDNKIVLKNSKDIKCKGNDKDSLPLNKNIGKGDCKSRKDGINESNEKLKNNTVDKKQAVNQKNGLSLFKHNKPTYNSTAMNSPYYHKSQIEKDNEQKVDFFLDLYQRDMKMLHDKDTKITSIHNNINHLNELDFKTTCSFIPLLHKQSHAYLNHHQQHRSNSSQNIMNKSLDILHQREINQFKFKQRLNRKEIKECTFTPDINSTIKQNDRISIMKQVPLINDYVLMIRNHHRSKSPSLSLQYNDYRPISVSPRKFLITKAIQSSQQKSSKEKSKNRLYYRSLSMKSIHNCRSFFGIDDFYYNSNRDVHSKSLKS